MILGKICTFSSSNSTRLCLVQFFPKSHSRLCDYLYISRYVKEYISRYLKSSIAQPYWDFINIMEYGVVVYIEVDNLSPIVIIRKKISLVIVTLIG